MTRLVFVKDKRYRRPRGHDIVHRQELLHSRFSADCQQ
jgi:hypothetical protein